MLRSINDLENCAIRATDGTMGRLLGGRGRTVSSVKSQMDAARFASEAGGASSRRKTE